MVPWKILPSRRVEYNAKQIFTLKFMVKANFARFFTFLHQEVLYEIFGNSVLKARQVLA